MSVHFNILFDLLVLFFFTQNSETLTYHMHAFLPLTIAKLSTPKNCLVSWPTLQFADSIY